MKKALIILNVVLVAAVAYLFYLHYSYIESDKHKLDDNKAAVQNSLKIAYFELDTIQNNYEYYIESFKL